MTERGEYGVFVSDIARGVTDEQLKEEFSKIGDVLEAVVVKNKHSGETKGYGFVKFYSMADAQHAIETPNPPLFKDGITGKPQMVKITLADSKNTLYIGHIPKNLTEKEVKAELEEISLCTLKSFEFDGQSKLYGYAQFKDHETTIKAIKLIQKSKYTASLTPSKRGEDGKSPSTKVLFIRGIRSQDEGELLRKQLGPELIEKVVVPLDSQKKTPLGHAFIYCNSTADAKIIMDHNHDFDFMGQKLTITWGLPKQRKMMDGSYFAGAPGAIATPPYDYHYYFPGSVPQDYYYPQIPIVDPRRSSYTGSGSQGMSSGKFDHKKDLYHPYPMVPPTTNPYGKYESFGYPQQDRYKSQGGKPPQSKYRFSPY